MRDYARREKEGERKKQNENYIKENNYKCLVDSAKRKINITRIKGAPNTKEYKCEKLMHGISVHLSSSSRRFLHRERPFLYDKKNSNFKNILMKENAWKKISKIMIATNYCNTIVY